LEFGFDLAVGDEEETGRGEALFSGLGEGVASPFRWRWGLVFGGGVELSPRCGVLGEEVGEFRVVGGGG